MASHRPAAPVLHVGGLHQAGERADRSQPSKPSQRELDQPGSFPDPCRNANQPALQNVLLEITSCIHDCPLDLI